MLYRMYRILTVLIMALLVVGFALVLMAKPHTEVRCDGQNRVYSTTQFGRKAVIQIMPYDPTCGALPE